LGDEGRVHGGAGSLWFTRDGQVVFTVTGQLFFGVLFYLALIAGLLALAASL
jgi:hypothetical protein